MEQELHSVCIESIECSCSCHHVPDLINHIVACCHPCRECGKLTEMVDYEKGGYLCTDCAKKGK